MLDRMPALMVKKKGEKQFNENIIECGLAKGNRCANDAADVSSYGAEALILVSIFL